LYFNFFSASFCTTFLSAGIIIIIIITIITIIIIIIIIIIITTAVELSLGGSIPYTIADKTNKNKYT